MQQVPNPGCADSTTSTAASSAPPSAAAGAASPPSQEPRWNRVPRVQPVRNQNDQRVPLYVDQTVPVWPLGDQQNARSRSSRETVNVNGLRNGHTHGDVVAVQIKGVRKRADVNEPTEWEREIPRPESHSFSVCEILQCSSSVTSLKWSGIEQDLFTCTAFVSKDDFLTPSAHFVVSNKKSKLMSKNPFL